MPEAKPPVASGASRVTLVERVTNRSAATVVWLVSRLAVVVGTVLSGWLVYEIIIVPIIDDDDRVLAFVALWLVMAYVFLPRLQRLMAKIYVPDYFVGRTRTNEGLLGDPVNLAARGPAAHLLQAMEDGGWTRADTLTWRSGLKLVGRTLVQRPYAAAPVSPLFVFRRKQDFAFEQEIPGKPSHRHHVRFWRCPEGWFMPGGLHVDWVGAGTYDRSVGLSLFTLQITHKIGEDTDLERDYILQTIKPSAAVHTVHWFQNYFSGYRSRNGCGDAISTDGNLPVIQLLPDVPPT